MATGASGSTTVAGGEQDPSLMSVGGVGALVAPTNSVLSGRVASNTDSTAVAAEHNPSQVPEQS